MPTPLTLPFPPLVCIDRDSALDSKSLLKVASRRLKHGISICIRSETGDPKRGGYFFHFTQKEDGFAVYDFHSVQATLFPNINDLLRFINHASGRQYDEEMWEQSQKMNLRSDVP